MNLVWFGTSFGFMWRIYRFRDFHSEMKEVLDMKDPTYSPSFAAAWKEHLKAATPEDADPCTVLT